MIRESQLNKRICKEKQEKKLNINISYVFFFLFLLLFVVGCSKKELSAESFSKKMSNKDYAVVDISDNNKKIMLAVGDYYQVYYYKFSSTKKSKEFIKNEINGLKSKNNIIKKEKNNSYEKYLISNKNVYTIYSRIDDTCISVSTVKTYSNNVDQLFDYLGY